MKVLFTDTIGVDQKYRPSPSKTSIPNWYKKLESYHSKLGKIPRGDGITGQTIKRCMPVFDAINAGYIIYSYVDVWITQRERFTINEKTGIEESLGKEPWYEWPSFKPIEFHSLEQAPNHPNRNGHNQYPKWINAWGLKTPKGYSALFIPPMHQEIPFSILPGVVDTDKYNIPVNFPFVLNDINFEGLIPAGTPLAQVIPFKRKTWNIEYGNEKDLAQITKDSTSLRSVFFDSYKNKFRQQKEFN